MNKNIVGICLILLFSLNISLEVSAKEGSGSLTIIHSALLDIEHSYFSNRNENTEKAALDKQAGLFQKIRETEPDLLIVNVGNVFLSTDTIDSKSQAILKANAELDYEAINLSYRDFRQGKKTTNQLIKSGMFPFISANLIDESTGELLVKPFIIKNTPAGKIAILGVTQSPAGLKILSHLQQQLAGIHIEPPIKAIEKWLPKAKAQADHIVLLYYGSWAGLKPIKEKFSSELAAIFVGGTRAEYLPADSVPPIIGTSGNGQHVALVKLNFEGEVVNAEVKQIPLDSNISSYPEIQKLINADNPITQAQDLVPVKNNSTSANQPRQMIIGKDLRLGMPLPEAMGLLGIPEKVRTLDATTDGKGWLDYTNLGLAIASRQGGKTVEAIKVDSGFKGQFENGLKMGDLFTSVIVHYGMPTSMTPQAATYLDKGLTFRFQDQKVIGVTLELTDLVAAKVPVATVRQADQQKIPVVPPVIQPPSETVQEKTVKQSSIQSEEPVASGENKAVRISILEFEERDSIDGKPAPKDMKFIVLNTRWQNIHPKQKVDKDRIEGKRDPTMGVGGLGWGGSSKPKEFVEMDVAYQIPRLLDHAYLLADGLAYHLHATTDSLPEGIARGKTFSLSKHGEVREGRLVFAVPSDIKALAFQFFDFSYGEVVLPFQGSLADARKLSAPVLATKQTKRLDLFVTSVDFRSIYQGHEASNGWHYAVLDLGGKSLLGTPGMGQILQISPRQYTWTRTGDGYFYYAADSATAEQGMLRFTPQVPAYQEVAFLMPKDIETFDLGVRLQNEVVWLTLRDKGLSQIPEPAASHRDKDVMQVSVYGVRTEEGKQVVDIGIQSLQKQQGIEIQTRSQFALLTKGGKVRLDTAATQALPHRPPEPFIIPPETYLRFELAYETIEQPEALYFRGFESEAKLALTTAQTDKARMVKTEKEEKSQVRPQSQPSSLTAHNEAVELTLVDYELVESINGQKADNYHVFLVLSTHWKNILKKPKKDVPWAHRSLGNFSQTKPDIDIAFLSDKKGHLFLETEGKNKLTFSPLTQHLPMPLTGNQFIISKLGDEADGKVAFQVNKSTLLSPALTLLDPTYGDIRINLPGLEQTGLIDEEDQQQYDKKLVSHVDLVKTIDQKEEISKGKLKHYNLSSHATLNVSSSNSGIRVYSPKRAIDGNLDTSWFTADGDAANQGKTPFFELIFDKDVIVSELKMFGNREYANGYDFISGVFQLFDQSGNEVYNSKVVELPAPHRDITLSIPDISDVRRVRFSSMSDESMEPGFSELEVIGIFEASSDLQNAEEIVQVTETTESQADSIDVSGGEIHSASNEFIKVFIDDFDIISNIKDVSAGEGYEFVVVSFGILYLAPEQGEYAISNIAEHLFLIAGEGYTVEVASETKMLADKTFPQSLKLTKNSTESRGKIVFRVRKKDLKELSIEFLDTRFKDISVPLQGTVEKTPDNTKFGTYRKGKLEVAVYGLECLEENCFVDIGVKSGIKNTTLQYNLSSSIYLVRDGYDYVPLAEANAPYNLQKVTLFNPDHERRGFYPLPKLEENTHYGLYLGLPDGHHFTATLTPERNLPTLPTSQEIFADGSVAEISILGFKQVENFADTKPSQGSRLLVLDLLVSSPSGSNTYLNIEPFKQFQLQNMTGKRWKAKALVYPKDGTDMKVFKHYAGMDRRFTLVYEVPESNQNLRLEYSGFKKNKILPITLLTLSGKKETSEQLKPAFRAVLSASKPDDKDYAPADVFSDEDKNLYLVMSSSLEKNIKVNIDWFVTEAEGRKQDEKLTQTATMHFKPDQSGIFTFKAPKGGFKPGKYRVEMSIDEQKKKILPFEIRFIYPSAEYIIDDSQIPLGFNIAFTALGGKVERWSSEKDKGYWAAKNLIDGKPIYSHWNSGMAICHSCGWASIYTKIPQELVFSFNKNRSAQIQAVVIDTTTDWSSRYPEYGVKYAEVWVSQESPERGFKKVAGARLSIKPGRYLIRLPDTTVARYVKIIILSNHGGSLFQAGEIDIIEKAEHEVSILRDYPINLALPSMGGAPVRWTSQRSVYSGVSDLIDNTVKTEGWEARYNSKLPQDFVFAFDDDQEVLLGSIVINPKTTFHSNASKTWPKRIQVSISETSPFDGFKDVGEFTVAQKPVPQTFNIGKYARFVRLRILETHGIERATLGEVKLIEGWEKGYQSILLRRETTSTISQTTDKNVLPDEKDFIEEQEPNNSLQEANTLELNRYARGQINPLGEEDFWTLQIPESKPVITKFEIMGSPNIRTSFSLRDVNNRALYQFDPGRIPSEHASFSLPLNPGEQLIKVTEPPTSVVVIWDTSGSMDGKTTALEKAVTMYLDQLRPRDKVALIHFSDKVNVLSNLSSDKEKIYNAIKGKFFANGGTAIYDALIKGLSLLKGIQGNRAIILMTDGIDTDSKQSYSELWRRLDEERVRIYTIGLGRHWGTVYLPQVAATGKRYLNNISSATDGKAFFAPSKNDLTSIYQEISDELQQISTYYLKPEIVKVAPPKGDGYLTVAATRDVLTGANPTQIELILDASGSMRERKRKIDGRLKIDVAKDVMHELIDGLPEGMEVGLRVYGHRIREGRKGDCQDSELLVPFGKLDKNRLHRQVAAMQALGTTPLAYSLLKAGEDFSQSPGEKILILVTDGKEECDMDPAFAARTLVSKGLKVRVDVVGFALAEEKTKADMRQVASITGGRFYDAQDRSELLNALRRAISLPYQVFDNDGKLVATGTTGGDAKKLRDGIYTVKVQPPGQEILEFNIRITENQYTRLEIHRDQKQVKPHVLGPYTKQAVEQIQVSGEPRQRSVTLDQSSTLQVSLLETPYGLRVKQTKPQGLAQQAGLKSGDILTLIDGNPLRHELDLQRFLNKIATGKQASGVITVRRAADEMALEIRGKDKTRWQTEVTSQPVSQSVRVRNAQRWLSQLGFNPGPADGLWGRKTERAVQDFQRWYPDGRLNATGQLDGKTYQALESGVQRGLKRSSTTKSYKSTDISEQRRHEIERQQREEQRRREAEEQQRQKQMIDQGIDFLRQIWRK